MKKIKFACLALLSMASIATAQAGGLLTNTNQNIAFLRNPARDATIGIDGVYSNPAGVAFMNEGMHISINWQYAHQTREIESQNRLFALGAKNGGQIVKNFKGVADAPFIPSVQAAYNKGNWSFQFNFAVTGGGGKCTFENGLGSFESTIAQYAQKFGALNDLQQLSALGVPGVSNIPTAKGYDMDSFLEGNQYYFGFTLGTAYKINEHWSIYGGVRANYGSASYKAKIDNINVVTTNGNLPLMNYVGAVSGAMNEAVPFANNPLYQQAMINGVSQKLQAQGMDPATAMATATQTVNGAVASLNGAAAQLSGAADNLQPYLKDGVNLQADQSGFSVAPIIGIHYKGEKFNIAAKYEFRTHMRLSNTSNVKETPSIHAIAKFQDGTSIEEDIPAYLAVGAEYKIADNWRVSAGYHHFFDTESKKYGNAQDHLSGGTNEFLWGVEWDAIKNLTLSAGGQMTRYSNTDAFMNDMSFVVNSGSFGFGLKYQISEKVAVNAAYFTTKYADYKSETPDATGTLNTYTRTNRVFGLGVDLTL